MSGSRSGSPWGRSVRCDTHTGPATHVKPLEVLAHLEHNCSEALLALREAVVGAICLRERQQGDTRRREGKKAADVLPAQARQRVSKALLRVEDGEHLFDLAEGVYLACGAARGPDGVYVGKGGGVAVGGVGGGGHVSSADATKPERRLLPN